jgi:hypothetical protein
MIGGVQGEEMMKSRMLMGAACVLGLAIAWAGDVAPAGAPGAQGGAAQGGGAPAPATRQGEQAAGGANPNANALREVTVTAIPGVIAAGAKWTQVWQNGGNNADGIVATPDGGILLAQEDLNKVTKLDKNGKATVFLANTHGVGSLSVDSKGRVMSVERMVPRAISYLTPEHKILADTFNGKPMSDLGRLNDLVADKKGGAYFTVGGLYYANASGKVISIGENLRTNGIMLSATKRRCTSPTA